MGVKQAQLVLGLLKDGSLSIRELPAASQDLDYQVRETSFLAKDQTTLLSLGGYLQGRQAYYFSHAVTHVSKAAGQARAEETLPLWRLHSHQPQQDHHLIPASGSCQSLHLTWSTYLLLLFLHLQRALGSSLFVRHSRGHCN